MTTVLAAGDRFILPQLFSEELQAALDTELQVKTLELPWPDVPFAAVGNVNEASGDEQLLIDALVGCDAMVTQLAPVTEKVLAASPQLKFIGVSRGGPSNIDLEACERHGVTVCNVPGRNGPATAEMSLGLLLAVLRRIPATQRTLENGIWEGSFYRADQVGFEVEGATIGLIGAGAVGSRLATALHAMGATVLVYDPFLPEQALQGVVERVQSVEELLSRSQVVSIHARLNEQTAHVINARSLSLMPRGSYLVNAARGGLVDYDAVAEALETGQLAGAAFDVFPTEPVDFSHPIFEAAAKGLNVVMTPHIAGASTQTAVRAARGTATELARFLNGQPLLAPLTESAKAQA
ncbi:2-hydroxyacid dehydrogenase [Glutamicibacter sp. NPDC087344]|uniref:2-hydroxyacid dehydrogenase n=1 Tax=Glutamicibacter sp. NPDC087344 TaxID=3363994 RepID=UPI003814359F